MTATDREDGAGDLASRGGVGSNDPVVREAQHDVLSD